MSTTNPTQELTVVFSKPFCQILCDFYQSKNKFYITRKQIGEALEYCIPDNAIVKIHDRNSDRLDKFSTYVNLTQVEGSRIVVRNTIVYDLRGVMEICRFSRQPKADAFMDFVWDVMETLFNGEAVLTPTSDSNQSINKLQADIDLLMGRVSQLENNQALQSLQSPSDLIRHLIDLRQDSSHNGNATYRSVYKSMYDKKKWKKLLTEYKHKHSVIHATKATLVADDPNVRDLFNQTVRDMISESNKIRLVA